MISDGMEPTTLNQVLTALADPTRRAILDQLADGERRVTDLARPFDLSLNAVSKHIHILERANLVRRRRRGREHLLSYNPQPLDETVEWVKARRADWNTRLATLDSLLQQEQLGKEGFDDH
jgi:DNA-binding transcriptional ArsR family regulator